MNWLLLTALSVLLVSVGNLLQRVLMRDEESDAASYTVVFALLLTIFYFVTSLFFGFKSPVLNWSLVLYLASAVLWGFGTVFLFKAMKLIEASEVTIFVTLRILIAILASVLFLGEIFDFSKLIGTLILIFSVLIVANIKKGIKFNAGILYSILVAIFYGTAVVIDAFNLKSFEVISYLPIINFLIFLVLLVSYPKVVRRWKVYTNYKFLKKMLPVVMFSCGQAYAYYFAIQKGNLSQIAPINQSQVIFTVLLAAIFLGERDHLIRKVFAAICVIVGVILLL